MLYTEALREGLWNRQAILGSHHYEEIDLGRPL